MEEEVQLEPKKPKTILRVLATLVSLFFLSYIILSHYYKAPSNLGQEVTIIIEKGDSVKKIARMLADNSVVSNSLIFRVCNFLFNHRFLQPGEYEFKPRTSMADVITKIASHGVVIRYIRILEGLTNKEIVDVLNQDQILKGTISNLYTEGYLLPDTYFYEYGHTRQEIVDRMYKAGNSLIEKLWEIRRKDLPYKNQYEAVILASIVEKETPLASERERVAGVFVNRLKKKMKLQADPTVIYSVTNGASSMGKILTKKDLQHNSKYNTYIIAGLPVGAICNPGKKSIEAAFNPSSTKDIFFVVNGAGGHNFSSNLVQHNEYVRQYREKQTILVKP